MSSFRSFYADMRRAGYEIGPSKAELARMMERVLLQLELGTPDLKETVMARLGSQAVMAKVRDLQAAWQQVKRRVVRTHPDRFLVEGKILCWNSADPAGDGYAAVYRILRRIYDKHRRRYHGHADSKQMCLMWSTSDPPDVIEGTEPFDDIEEAFGISLDEDAAMT